MSLTVPMYGFCGGGGVGGVLTVTAPAGVTVSISKDGKIKTKVANANGIAVFKGLKSGTWQVTITSGSSTASKDVVVTTDYSTSITFFSATINISYPSGSTCTCTDGKTTLKAPNTGGSWTCVVPNAGTWTVKCTNGSLTKTQQVSITTSGQVAQVALRYRVYYYKRGDLCTADSGDWGYTGNVAFNSDHILLTGQTGSRSLAHGKTPVPVAYKTMYVVGEVVSNTNGVALELAGLCDYNFNSTAAQNYGTVGDFTLPIDISAVNNLSSRLAVVRVGLSSSIKVKIYEVYFE